MFIPAVLLKRLYTFSSLTNTANGLQFSIKNRLNDAQFTGLKSLKIAGKVINLNDVSIEVSEDHIVAASEVSVDTPINFPLRKQLNVCVSGMELPKGKYEIEIAFDAKPFGSLKFSVEDAISDEAEHLVRIPRDKDDDYSEAIIARRQRFIEDYSGIKLQHISKYSFDPHTTQGNIEHFVGVAQVPIGLAGPLRINGEHAIGDFIIPLATAEGTLVASYNRGIKLLNLCGGPKCTVMRDAMQRAPVFVFEDARGARDFAEWVHENTAQIAAEAEATSSIAKFLYVDSFLSNKFTYLRFNFATGDAAGQNMVGRAVYAGCAWILDHYKGHEIKRFYLESNFATDKKASQVNIMRTRGKRVTAEITIKRDILIENMRVEPEQLAYHAGVANVGSILSGANNNGLHSANAITAMFIATGQDVANVAESSAAIIYTEITPERDLYISITIPSLIVATFGGGVGLATQRECLDIMGCYGRGKVNKFAEIVAGVVLAGELSLASAISSQDWVSSHEQYGRNRQ
ncbi:MAG: hydroxymethylglutaryl-CoA reductase [Chitinophagales bacterium]|nr:hydroxymethylglutaryl-CoA reductase [Chitinophagales bacterium]